MSTTNSSTHDRSEPVPLELIEVRGLRGWDAIEESFARVYGDMEPVTWRRAASSDPLLDGINVYQASAPRPHWHYVTFGFSEVYEKESAAEFSGWGFELTFRLACQRGDEHPPEWPYDVLQELACYVAETHNPFAEGHTIDLSQRFVGQDAERIAIMGFVPDPQLESITTPNGRLTFLQIVPLVPEELEAILAWSPTEFISLMAVSNPLLVWSPQRRSMLADPEFAQTVAKRTHEEGSSSAHMYMNGLMRFRASGWFRSQAEIVIGQQGVERLKCRLLGRIPFGRPLELIGDGQFVLFEPKSTPASSVDGTRLTVPLGADSVRALCQKLEPSPGVYEIPGVSDAVIRVRR